MLNNNSVKILQSITGITNSVIISYPTTTISNSNSDIQGNIDFSKLDEEFEEYGIFDLSSFLNAIDVLDEPVVLMNEGIITATDTDSSISFVTSSPASLGDFTCDPLNITTTVAAPSIVELNVDTALMTKIRKGVGVFKTLKDLFIVKDDTGVYLRTGNKESFARRDNSYKIKLDTSMNTGKNFEIAIPVDNFLALPAIDFELKVKYNEQADAHRIVVENAIFQFVLSIRV